MGAMKAGRYVAKGGVTHTVCVEKDPAQQESLEAAIRDSQATTIGSCLMRRRNVMIRSPKGVREQNDAAVSAATKRFRSQQRRWNSAVKVLSKFMSRFSPAKALKKARDCYVRTLGGVANHISSSAPYGVPYGAGYNTLNHVHPCWTSSGSKNYENQVLESQRALSTAFRESFNAAQFQGAHILSQTQRSRSARAFSSGRSSARIGMQPMPIYTITEQ